MKTYWRTAKTPLSSHGDWRRRIDRKNREMGTSAPTLASAWAGPVEVMGALRQVSRLAGLRIDEVVVEAQSAVDKFRGDRNHDLVVAGTLADGSTAVVCVEAKAGEDLGDTVKDQRAAAARAVKKVAEANETITDPLARP